MKRGVNDSGIHWERTYSYISAASSGRGESIGERLWERYTFGIYQHKSVDIVYMGVDRLPSKCVLCNITRLGLGFGKTITIGTEGRESNGGG